MKPVIWIISGLQWSRAILRAELIERGYEVVGYVALTPALVALAFPGTAKPGIILVELRDRAQELAATLAAGSGSLPPGGVPAGALEESVREQALSALLNLGYPKARAERVLAAAAEDAGDDATIETLVRAALKRLAR